MKRKRKIIFIGALVFLLLFAARIAYELSRPDILNAGMETRALISASEQDHKNYASAKVVVEQAVAGAQVVEQKYERVSRIESKTENWDSDIAAVKLAIEGSQALVQREDAFGLEGDRALSLSLGVTPAAFDPMVETMKGIGRLVSANVTKTDRTSDFRALQARRLSLEKTRDGLAALRNEGAALSDRVELETRILEIEGQIQELGVSLGDYSELNSFCTVNFTLRETRPMANGRRILTAVLSALGWSALVYLGLAASALATIGVAALVVRLADRLRDDKKKEK